jgi:hypothetical protein
VFPALAVDPAVTEIPARGLGYADCAEESYAVFKALRTEGVIPEGVRFQVSVPTPYASLVSWVREEDQERFFRPYADAMGSGLGARRSCPGTDVPRRDCE